MLRLAGGGGAELLRRWCAALLSVPADEREAVVAAVEGQLAREYQLPPLIGAVSGSETLPTFDIASPPVEKEGFSETTVRTYAAAPKSKNRKKGEGHSAA